jgi:hypothetical protein
LYHIPNWGKQCSSDGTERVTQKKANPCGFRQNKGDCLTSFANEHLDQDRLERLAKALVEESLGCSLGSSRELTGDRAHADYCAGCKASVEMMVIAETKFREMMSIAVATGVKNGECPPDRIWASVATGLIADREAAAWIQHASECDNCGRWLREAAEDLALEVTAEELAQVQKSGTPEWRSEMARAMSAAACAATPPSAGWLEWLRRQVR